MATFPAWRSVRAFLVMMSNFQWLTAVYLGIYCGGSALAWDYEGHRIVNQIALASLPTNFPVFTFTRAARERIAFLVGEPDRWRNTTDLPLKHFNGPDHYLDFEELADVGLGVTNLSHFRYEFVTQLALGRNGMRQISRRLILRGIRTRPASWWVSCLGPSRSNTQN